MISVALSMVFLLTGCNDSLSDADFEKQASEILASAKLETAYEGHDFLTDGIGEMDIDDITYVDGDTTHFQELDSSDKTEIPVRYYAINTPESTSSIEKWGKSASDYTDSVLESATHIVVSNPDTSYHKPAQDSYGTRYLGFVWYTDVEDPELSDFKLLNLQIVLEGFSKVANSEYFSDEFTAAVELAEKHGENVWSPSTTVDPNYYEGSSQQLTLEEVSANYADYVEDGDPTVTVSGVVFAYDSDGAWIEDDTEDGKTYGLYLFNNKGYKPLSSIGYRLQATGNLSLYNGLLELGGLTYQTGQDSDIHIIGTNQAYSTKAITSNEDLQSANDSTSASLSDYLVTSGYTSDSGAMNLTGKVGGQGSDVSVYIPASIHVNKPSGIGRITDADYFVGKSLEVSGVVSTYNGNKQIEIPANKNALTINED